MRGYRFCQSRQPPKALENDARRNPKATQKREKALQKRVRNYAEKSCLEKPENVAKRAPGGTPEAPKNRLKTDPELHPSPCGPKSGPRCPGARILWPRPHILSISATILHRFWKKFATPKAAKQASAEAENFSATLHISSRLRDFCSFF